MDAAPIIEAGADIAVILTRLNPEFPELLPAAIEAADKVETYKEQVRSVDNTWGPRWEYTEYLRPMIRGSQQWEGCLWEAYRTLEKKHLKTNPLPFLEITDEELLQWVSTCGCSSHYDLMKKRYAPDLVWEPDLTHLRQLWNEINEEKWTASSRSERKLNYLCYLRQRIEKEHDADIEQAYYDSPEEMAKREAIRLQEEKALAERDANLKLWETNQRKRRVADMNLPDLGHLDIHLLNYEGQRLAHKFYREFFSPEFCGFDVIYRHRGYRLPPESGYHHLLFSVTGTVFDQSELLKTGDYKNYDENTAMIEGSNFILIYAVFVCGYPAPDNWLSPNNYRRAVHGFANWVKQHTDIEEGKVLEHGTRQYWERLFNTVTTGIFELQAENVVKDFPRNLYNSVLGYWGEEEMFPFRRAAE
jgi:hypothetical protein